MGLAGLGGETAIVTGAASGIGAAARRLLASFQTGGVYSVDGGPVLA